MIMMEAIKLKTRLGKCNLDIQAHLRNDKTAMLAEYAMQFLIWHVVGSQAFNSKSDFKRDALFSDELAKHVRSTSLEVLDECFENIQIKTSKYDAPDKIAKLIKEFVGLGMSEVDAKAMAEQVQAKVTKPQPTEETVAVAE
jgi:hypothetical protein